MAVTPKTMTIGTSTNPVDFKVTKGDIKTLSGDIYTSNGNVIGNNIKNKGSASQPIYFDANGVAQVCTDIEAGPTGNFVEVEGDVMEGALEMFSTALTTKTGRNIQAGTEALTAGTSPLPTGDIYIQYI